MKEPSAWDDPYVVVMLKRVGDEWKPVGAYGPFEGTTDAVEWANKEMPADAEWDFFRLETP